MNSKPTSGATKSLVMKGEPDVKIVRLKEEDMPVVAQFLKQHFYSGEPLAVSLNWNPPAEEIAFLGLVKEGFSFKAVNLLEKSEDNIMGVLINSEVSIGKQKKTRPVDPRALKIRKLLTELEEKSKIWEAVNNETHFNMVALAVDKKYYGQKLSQKLVEESMKLAKSLNYNYVSIECSSFYSTKLAVALGFELLAEIPYSEYLDENNEPVFKVSEPHTAIKKFFKRL